MVGRCILFLFWGHASFGGCIHCLLRILIQQLNKQNVQYMGTSWFFINTSLQKGHPKQLVTMNISQHLFLTILPPIPHSIKNRNYDTCIDLSLDMQFFLKTVRTVFSSGLEKFSAMPTLENKNASSKHFSMILPTYPGIPQNFPNRNCW